MTRIAIMGSSAASAEGDVGSSRKMKRPWPRWHDGGILLGLGGIAFGVIYAAIRSPGGGAYTATLGVLAIASRVMYVRFKPHPEARAARRRGRR
jgi:hypothetical protein